MSFFIECNRGRYGYNCNQSCDGCLSDSCEKELGVCTDTSGCKPGWQHGQPKCDKGILKKYSTFSLRLQTKWWTYIFY
jgi:hypothetical protein